MTGNRQDHLILRPLAMLGLLGGLSFAPTQATAQDWLADRFDNAIVNADSLSARYKNDVQAQLRRMRMRATKLPPPTQAEVEAMRDPDTWWTKKVPVALGGAGKSLKMSLPYAYDSAMLNSAQMRVFGNLPAIRETYEKEVEGRYALRLYADARAEDINDPTRSLAVTDGNSRLLSRDRSVEVGFRKRLITGAEVAIGQRFASIATNSNDFIPGEQSRLRTFVTVVQPLLRDSGVEYTRSLHEVARLDALMGKSEFRRQVENHLMEVARAYWALYLARATYYQRAQSTTGASKIVDQLSGRASLDADVLLLSRARSAQSQREAEQLRSRASVSNAEVRLRALLNDPRLDQSIGEVVPVGTPLTRYEPLGLQTIVQRAVAFRPEVQQAFLQQKAAVLREGQAQIESLPRFDAVLEGNIGGRGLGTGQFPEAWTDTRDNANRPGFVAGLRLEIPLQQDDSKARLSRRKLETRQAEDQGIATVSTIAAEAELALNEYEVAWREVGARALALRAARNDQRLELERWDQGIGGQLGENAVNGLERLLSSQDRVADAEERLALAQTTFTVAFLALQRVQGTFLSVRRIGIQRLDDAARGPTFVARRDEIAAPPPSRCPVGKAKAKDTACVTTVVEKPD
ncbi:TolC family protein [Bosea sp. BK604]|uniref:TolC family protein n=1 Tax=Bosea sp. BK604 TaxID=2512180 RepID=UPI00104D349C|nr:TolC family protein [Bosea sp. BK604]TCR65734.1 outer membrane protein TolC [Bosea sp. BK604]